VNTNVLARLIGAATQVNPVSALTEMGLRASSQEGGRHDLARHAPGQHVRGHVGAKLADGLFRVSVDGVSVKLPLPAGTRPGDIVELRVATADARTVLEPVAVHRDVQTRVSEAGRLLGRALEESTGTPVRQTQPVVDEPTADAPRLAQALARAVERSGLFYESHQARWVGGEFPLTRLLEEPQARGESTAAHTHRPEEAAHAAAARPAAAPDVDGAEAAPELAGPQATTPSEAAERPAEPPVARDALPLVRQQIETLEHQRIAWHGEVWPGQAMEWEIVDERGADAADASEQHEWATHVALELPALGRVAIRIELGGRGLALGLVAADAGTAAAMRTEAPALVGALEAVGLPVRALKVTHDERPR